MQAAATSRRVRIARRLVPLAVLGAVLWSAAWLAGCDDDKEKAENTVTVNERPPPEEGEGEGGEGEGGEATEPAAQGGDDEAPVDFEMGPSDPGGSADGGAPDGPTPRTAADFEGAEAGDTVGAEAAADPTGDTRPKRVEVSASFLKVEPMLEPGDVWKALDYKGLLEHGAFVGHPPSKTYNATRLASENGGFGVALQVWKPGSAAAASRRFDELYKNSIGGERSKDVGDLSFRSDHHGLRSVVFLDKRRSAVAWVTCEAKLCEFEQLADLSRRIQRKL